MKKPPFVLSGIPIMVRHIRASCQREFHSFLTDHVGARHLRQPDFK